MKYLTSIENNETINNVVLLLSRFIVGFGMLSHGYPKLEKLLSGQEIEFYNFLGLGPDVTLTLVVIGEFVASIFIILGLFTRLASFLNLFTMIIAAFVVHAGDAFADREMSILYLVIFLILFAFGPGLYSVDGMISGRKRKSQW